MCVLQSSMSTGIVQYIRKSFFGPKTWGGAPCSLCSAAYGLSVCQAWQKREKNLNAACVQQASTWREEKIIIKKKTIKNVLQSNSANGHRFTTASSQQRPLYFISADSPYNYSLLVLSSYILIQNIVQALGVFYLYILFMIELPSWDTVSMNLAQ